MKYLGIDWGLKRIGLALSEGDLASPWQTITIKGLNDAVEKITQLSGKEDIDLLVMGLPEGEMGKNVQRAAKSLQAKGLKVELTDETLSTHDAKALLLRMAVKKKARQEDNALAASLILQNYLDERF